MTNELTHFNEQGEAHMVDVGDKQITQRVAVTSGHITMQNSTLALIQNKGHKKGDVLGIARIAGIMASKKTSGLIPLCHPVALTNVELDLECDETLPGVRVTCTAKTADRTGIEMEALVAAQIALATVYDMCKAVDRGMVISDVKLDEKKGGKSGHWVRDAKPIEL